MKTKKRRFPNFQYRECDAFAEYLHQQSLKGWHFKEWRFGLVFEQGEPEDITYTVEVFPKGSEQDLRPDDDTKEYAEYCEAAGWKLLDAHGKFCIFKRMRKDAVPIVAPEERFENVRKAEWKRWNRYIMVFILMAMDLFGFWKLSFENEVFSNTSLLFLLAWTLLSLCGIYEGIYLYIWGKKQKQRLEQGKCVSYGKRRIPDSRAIIFVWLLAVLFIIGFNQRTWDIGVILLTYVGIAAIAMIVSIWRPLEGANLVFQFSTMMGLFLIMFMVIVIKVTEERTTQKINDNHIRTDWTESVLGKAERGEITWPYESWDYTQYHSPHRWITDKIWKQEHKYLKDGRDCKDIWEAEAAYVIGDPGFYMYCIRFQEDVVRLHVEAEEELDVEEIMVLKEKLQIP